MGTESINNLIFGIHPVLEALRSGQTIERLYVGKGRKGKALNDILKLARTHGIEVRFEPWERLTQRIRSMPDAARSTPISHQGVVGSITRYMYTRFEDLLEIVEQSKQAAFFLILDQIQDPHNFGAMLRTAECAGVQGVIIPRRNAAGVTSTVMKVSAGAAAHIPVCQVTNLATTIDLLKTRDIWIAGTSDRAPDEYTGVDFTIPIAIVVGNEEKGIRPLVAKQCDFMVSIPMHGKIASLNASVSGAIIMFEVLRQRRKATP